MNCPVCNRKNPISSLDTGMMRCWWCGNRWSDKDSAWFKTDAASLKAAVIYSTEAPMPYKYVSTTEYPEGTIVVDTCMKMYQWKMCMVGGMPAWLDLDKRYQGDRDSLPLFGE